MAGKVTRPLGPLKPLSSGNTHAIPQDVRLIANGEFVETFGYDRDDFPFEAADFLKTVQAPDGSFAASNGPGLTAVVTALRPGQRTPVFHLGTVWGGWSWYLRLPGATGAPCACRNNSSRSWRVCTRSSSCCGCVCSTCTCCF